MCIEKQILQKTNLCKVKFSLPKEVAETAKSAHLVGDFNDWDPSAIPMKKTKSGTYHVVLELETGKEYQFRYLLDNQRWENDINADRFVPNGFGDSENSVLSI
jgi:1,4-alpha-glucan branching enzyme